MAIVFGLATRIHTLLDAGDAETAAPLVAAFFDVLAAVGLELRDPSGDEVPDDVAALAAARDAARAAKDWATADAMRDQLVGWGWVVEDSSGGTAVRRP